MPTNKLFDEILSGALDILRLSAAARARTVRRLQRMARELIGKLSEEHIEASTIANVQKVLKLTDAIIKEHYAAVQLELDLPAIAEIVAKATSYSLEFVLGPIADRLPPANYLKSVASNVLIEGAPSADWWRAQEIDTQFKFANAVRAGLSASETNQQIISRIVGNAETPGIMDTARRNAASLVQTSVQAVANDARRNTFEANSHVIAAIQQVSTLDSHTSLVCIAYSEKQFSLPDYKPIGHKLPYKNGCPRHFNCRSVEVPITKSFKELGVDIPEPPGTTRASADGQLTISTSFDDFLKRKGQAFQDEVLGVGRADLWRAGKITLRDLVNGDGNPLSLEALRAKVARKRG
jgi:hypothetical protein